MRDFPMLISRLLRLAGVVLVAGTHGVLGAADAPATNPAPVVPTVPAAVAALVVLAEESTLLRDLRTRLQANHVRVQTELAASEESRPAATEGDVALAAWQARHDDLAKRVEAAGAAVARFDEKMFPAFGLRVHEAKQGVSRAWAAGKPTAVDNKRVTDAAATLDAALQAIEKLQSPAPAPDAGDAKS
jgi:hypothetical protein